jgi:hypothetical protein
VTEATAATDVLAGVERRIECATLTLKARCLGNGELPKCWELCAQLRRVPAFQYVVLGLAAGGI